MWDSFKYNSMEELRTPSIVSLGVFFIVTTLGVGGLVKEVCKKLPIPYPAAMFIIGITLGSNMSRINEHSQLFVQSMEQLAYLDATTLMNIMIPPMIFYAGFTSDIYILKTQILQITMLCFPSLILSAGLIALCLKFIFQYNDNYYSWGFAITFGAIVSCTDPLNFVKTLENAGAPKKFSSLIQGVSLFNNATSMILLLISVQFARGNYGDISNLIKYGLTLISGGILLGMGFGIITIYWVKQVNHDNALTINVTICTAYLTYFAAEYVDWGIATNGVVAVMSLGIFMSAFTRQRIRSDSEHSMEVFWSYITYAVESMIFLITGIIVGRQILLKESPFIRQEDYNNLPLLFLCILGSRLVSIVIFMNLISHWGLGMKFSEILVFTYSGSRGAIQLCLALLVTQEKAFTDQQSDIILFHIAGVVIFSMVINGTTTGLLIRMVGMSRVEAGKEKILVNFLQEMKEQIEQRLQHLRDELVDKKVDWDKVRYFSGIDEATKDIEKRQAQIEKKEQYEEKMKLKQQQGRIDVKFRKLLEANCPDQTEIECSEDVDEDMVIEGRDRFLRALKQTYWDLFSQNQCSGKAMSLLVESVRWDLDTVHQRMCSWDFIYSLFYQPLYMRFLYWIKGFPILGRHAGNLLFDWVGMGYEVMSTYVKAQQETEVVIQDFPINHVIMQMIIKESQENRTNAERFISGYFSVSFPEIIRLIQNKRAALTVLVTEKKFCMQKQAFGELDAQEYLKMKLLLNNLVGRVEDIQPHWSQKAPHKKLAEMPLFKEFTPQLLADLCKNCLELIFDKDQCITREGELARYVYVLFRGRAIESCQSTYSNYTQVREIGSIISPHHIMLKASLYITQTVAEAMVEVIAIEIETMIKLVNKSVYMQQFLWQESLYALSRFYFQEMKPLGQLERQTIDKVAKHMKYAKYKKDQQFAFQGGILLSGKAEFRQGVVRQQSANQLEEEFTPDSPTRKTQEICIEAPHLFAPQTQLINLTALTAIDIYVFDAASLDKIQDEIANDLSLIRPKKAQFLSEDVQQKGSQLNRFK